MRILYLVFGENMAYHQQTYFSILSVLRYRRKEDVITVYTDNPSYYKRLNGKVNIASFNRAALEEWQNDTGYIYRAKIKAIEDCARQNQDDNLLFLDGDTVMLNDGLTEMDKMMDEGKGLMYVDEGHPSQMKGGSLRMWNGIKGNVFQGCTVSMRHNVWNSGVIGIPRKRGKKVTGLALEICDAILAKKLKCFTAEQYAFSIAMQECCNVVAATKWIAHYWGNKSQWLQLSGELMLRSFMSDKSIDQELEDLDAFPFAEIPVYVKKSNTRRRLIKIINKIYKQ